jgi:hypothetical protein
MHHRFSAQDTVTVYLSGENQLVIIAMENVFVKMLLLFMWVLRSLQP